MFRNSVALSMLASAFMAAAQSAGGASFSGSNLGDAMREVRRSNGGRRGKYSRTGTPKRMDPDGLSARTIRAQRGFTTWQLERLREDFADYRRIVLASENAWPDFLESRRSTPPLRHREKVSTPFYPYAAV